MSEVIDLPATQLYEPIAEMREPDTGRAIERAARFRRMVDSMTVTGPEDYELGVEECREIKALHASIDEERRSFTDPLNEVVKRINDKYRPALTCLAEAEKVVKGKLTTYTDAVERERRAAVARAEAERRAEQERMRLEVAERERQAREAAAHAIAAGNAAKAQAIVEQTQQETAAIAQAAMFVAPVQVEVAAAPAAAGSSRAKAHDYELEDLMAVVRHVAEHPEHLAALQLDEKVVRQLVKALGANLRIPGIRVFEKTTLRIGK